MWDDLSQFKGFLVGFGVAAEVVRSNSNNQIGRIVIVSRATMSSRHDPVFAQLQQRVWLLFLFRKIEKRRKKSVLKPTMEPPQV
jgi:hypothetical protein